jgi:tetratricopeptide (TPR) repeat protein
MKIPKIARDVSILIAFCGAFYLLIVLVRGKTTEASTSSNFSMDRLQGDRLMEQGNWKQAIPHFTKLVEKDKYNGLAQAQLSAANLQILYEQDSEHRQDARKGVLAPEQLKTSRTQLHKTAQQCIQTQQGLIRFDQYRTLALRNLAWLHVLIGNEDEAIEFLTEYINDGSYTEGSIDFDERFDALRHRDDFQQLIRIENQYSPHYEMGHWRGFGRRSKRDRQRRYYREQSTDR